MYSLWVEFSVVELKDIVYMCMGKQWDAGNYSSKLKSVNVVHAFSLSLPA